MSTPMTLREFDALPDDTARDAAIAGALGWRYDDGACAGWRRGNISGRGGYVDAPSLPKYYTGGDKDPFANWQLRADVERRLFDWHCGHLGLLPLPSRMYIWPNLFAFAGVNEHCGWHQSPHRAACRALVSAGLVPKETTDEG